MWQRLVVIAEKLQQEVDASEEKSEKKTVRACFDKCLDKNAA